MKKLYIKTNKRIKPKKKKSIWSFVMNIYEEEQKEKFWVWKSCIKQMSLSFQPRICPPLNLDFITKDRVEKKNEN